MDNEVVIHVVADDDVDRGFNSARAKSKKLGSDIEGEIKKVGPKLGDSLGGGMLSGLKSTLPSFGQAAGVIGALMAPTIGATVAAGLMGAAGGAGIIGGLTIAAKDPAVKAAGSSLGKTIGDDLKSAAADFVPVALSSLDQVRGAWKKMLPDIRQIFAQSSTFVGPLLDGITDGAGRIIQGIRAAVDGSRPVFDSFGRMFAGIGNSVGNLFEGIADDGDAGAAAIDDVSMAITNLIDITGKAINGLTEIKGKFEDLDGAIDSQRYKLEDNVSWLDLTADGYKKGSQAALLYREGLIGAAGSANDYDHYLAQLNGTQDENTDSTKNQTSALKELSDEMKAQTDPLFGLLDGQRKVRKAQEDYNKALREHGPQSRQARDALANLGQAAFTLNGRVGAAAGGFDGKLTPAMRTALRNAGLTTGQMRNLEKELRDSARAANAWEGTFTQTFVTRQIITRSNGTKFSTGAGSSRDNGKESGGVVGAAANGSTSSGLTMVGEHGPELLDLPPGTQVSSNPDTERRLSAGGGGPTSLLVAVDTSRADGLWRAILEGLRLTIRAEGGNVQQVLGVPGR